MRTDILIVVAFFPLFLGLVFLPQSESFVGTRKISGSGRSQPPLSLSRSPQQEVIIARPSLLSTPSSTTRARARNSLQARTTDENVDNNNADENDDDNTVVIKNIAFSTLSTARDNKPNKGNFFYNDEVISHLYGYMYLVGFFVAQDGLFLGNFFVVSSLAAWATQQTLLPCNPRIPALVAATTLASTLVFRYVIGFEPPLGTLLGETYQGPTESSALFELVICLLNIGWGFFGSWRTKEQVNGATYGF